MKKSLALGAGMAALLLAAVTMRTLAAPETITVTGEGKCAKCALHEADKCENTVQVQEDGKTVTYYLAQNKISKEFHDNICKESKKITVTGTVKEKDGKKTLTPSKIELAK